MTLSKNDYLKKEDIRGNCKFIRIMGVLDDLVIPSVEFRSYDEKELDGVLPNRECAHGLISHVSELEALGWKPCTAQEAGAPEEKWSPKKGESYIYATFDGDEVRTYTHTWLHTYLDTSRLAIGNVHKTPEEAIAWLKSKLDLKV